MAPVLEQTYEAQQYTKTNALVVAAGMAGYLFYGYVTKAIKDKVQL